MWCHAADLEAASERAAFHAERAGDRAAVSDAIIWLILAPWFGMAPPDEGIGRCEELRARAPDDRTIDAFADFVLGSWDAMLGRPDEGRVKHRRAHGILVDRG